MTEVDDQRTPERRGAPDRRRYNRRTPGADLNPPYYDVFERIALALEGIHDALSGQARPDPAPPGPPSPRAGGPSA